MSDATMNGAAVDESAADTSATWGTAVPPASTRDQEDEAEPGSATSEDPVSLSSEKVGDRERRAMRNEEGRARAEQNKC